MTKKDFELIAGVMRSQRARASHAELWRLDETARALASELATTNPRFNRSRFVAACMGEDSTDMAGRKVRYST